LAKISTASAGNVFGLDDPSGRPTFEEEFRQASKAGG
jgi:hypothetical protein